MWKRCTVKCVFIRVCSRSNINIVPVLANHPSFVCFFLYDSVILFHFWAVELCVISQHSSITQWWQLKGVLKSHEQSFTLASVKRYAKLSHTHVHAHTLTYTCTNVLAFKWTYRMLHYTQDWFALCFDMLLWILHHYLFLFFHYHHRTIVLLLWDSLFETW